MKRTTPILLLCAALCISFKSDRVNLGMITRIKQEGFNDSKVMQTLFELTDVNGPRLTGSAGMKHAEKWAVQKLKEWGLEDVHTERWGTFGKGWEIQKCYVAMTVPYYQALIAVPKAWTPGTGGNIAADAILVKTDSLDKYADKLNGKIVVLATGDAYDQNMGLKADASRLTEEDLHRTAMDPHITDADNPRGGRNYHPYVSRQKIDSFLMAEGAEAVISLRRGNMGTVFTSNGASRAWDAKPVLPELEMGSEHIYRLERLLAAGKKVSLEMDIKTSFSMADSTEYNVVGEIPGTDKELKNEIVMLGAHMDSWHAATGTTDNGTGTAVTMEAVRILKKLNIHPKRTIRIVLWSGEEQGLLGSRGYVKKHFGDRLTMQLKPEQEMVSAYYNLDNGGGKIRGIYTQNNDAVYPIFEQWLQPFKDLDAITVTNRNTGGTDHLSFDEIGIPGFQFIQDPLEYGSRTHHSNMDTYERANANDLMQASIIMASFVYNTAMRDEMLPRKPLPKKKG